MFEAALSLLGGGGSEGSSALTTVRVRHPAISADRRRARRSCALRGRSTGGASGGLQAGGPAQAG